MILFRNNIKLLLILLLSFFLVSCVKKPELDQNIIEKVSFEYNKMSKEPVEFELKGRTLYIFCEIPDKLPKDLNFSKDALKVVQDVLSAGTRSCLTVKSGIDFFGIIFRDRVRRIEIAFIRYVDDTRKLYANFMSRDEYFGRGIIDIKKRDVDYIYTNDIWEDIELPEFIAEQVVSNLSKINVILQVLMNIEGLEGDYSYIENELYFNYTIKKISEEEDIVEEIGEFNIKDEILKEHKNVCKKYRFKKYADVIIKVK